MLFLYCVCHALASAHCCLVVTCGKGLASWLSFVALKCMIVTFQIGILGQVWYLIVLITDLCPLSYFHTIRIVLHISALLSQ